MFDIKKEEQEIQNNFISFPDFMRLFTNKNPDVSLKKIVRFINNKIPDPYYFNVVFVEDDFLKIEDAFTNNFWDYLFSFENSETLGKDAELYIDNADFDGYYLYKNEVTSLLDIPSELLDKNLSPISKSDTITNNNNPDEIARLNAIIEQQAKEITELKDEIENLKKPETAQSVVNYDEFSIYGHTSENIKIAFEIIKKISEKCDPENPHSYPKKDDFIEYIRKYFTDNNSLAQSLYQIIMPEKVKGKGCPPKGVETFQGFI